MKGEARPVPVPVHAWRAAEFGGLDLLRGSFTTHAFARHTHETYSIGLLEHGAMTFRCRGAAHTLRPGLIGMIHPGEVHDGHAGGGDGWTYRNLHPDPGTLGAILAELGGRRAGLPRLPVVIDDAPLARALLTAHRAFEEPASTLARESLLHGALGALIARHADARPAPPRPGTRAAGPGAGAARGRPGGPRHPE